jgi:hypothetical protein
MTARSLDLAQPHDAKERLEQALIEEFLRNHGYSSTGLKLNEVSDGERRLLMSQASTYASGRLAEVDARAHLYQEVHGDVERCRPGRGFVSHFGMPVPSAEVPKTHSDEEARLMMKRNPLQRFRTIILMSTS